MEMLVAGRGLPAGYYCEAGNINLVFTANHELSWSRGENKEILQEFSISGKQLSPLFVTYIMYLKSGLGQRFEDALLFCLLNLEAMIFKR